MRKNTANIITGFRIVFSIVMLFFPVFSPLFFVFYLLAGFTDMIDGTIARKTNTASEFGAKLDTFADLLFVVACAIKILPSLQIPVWLWIWIGLIALIKLINILYGFIFQKKFVSAHTATNRLTGILLFLLPLTLTAVRIEYTAPIVCAVAIAAAVQEGYCLRKNK
ncbi:MAG: CDP-alcohol phosphatidyltransferase family protein [Acutalibacteraceae bacterium]